MSSLEATGPAGAASRAARRVASSTWFGAPLAVGMLLLVVVPAVANLRWAVTDATGLGPAQFVGADNVRRMLADPLFAASLRASLVHVAITVPVRMVLATAFALLLAAPRPGGRWYRAAVFLPTVVPDAALALLFLWVLNPVFGPLNGFLASLGVAGPVWLAEPWPARVGVGLMMLLPIGEAFLVVLAARRELGTEPYEAAAIDGAAPWQQLRYLTLPQLAPLLVLLTIRDVVLTLQLSFTPAYILTDGRPGHATLYLPLYIFDQAFEFAGFGYGALLSLVMLAVTGGLVAVIVLLARRWRMLPDA